jgi:hypothetical protein
MMKNYFLVFFFIFSTPIWGEEMSLKNDREGKSFFQSKSFLKKIKKATKEIPKEEISQIFEDSLERFNENTLCSFNLNQLILRNLKSISPKFDEYEGILYYLRSEDYFDDVTLKILLNAYEVDNAYLDLPKEENDLWLPSKKQTVDKSLELISQAKNKIKTQCLDDVYRDLYSDLFRLDGKMTSYFIEGLLVEAYEKKLIDYTTYVKFEKARMKELEKIPLTLKGYYAKMMSLRKNSPLPNDNERSQFSTAKLTRGSSRRIHLYDTYSDLQILLMSNVIKKLRSRLESTKVEILVYEREEVGEVITLEPMERFRFSLKILRKEMKMLSLNTYFKGITPSYLDLMTAAFESGIVSSLEVDELAGLEEIWNPKKSFWEKARFWIQSFGSVATILIPPPYGFIPALALVIIEATTQKKDQVDADLGLF